MEQFYSLKISSIKQETTAARAITFEVSKPLQQCVDLQEGQHITLRHTDKNRNSHNRCYSICSAPEDPKLQLGVKEEKHLLF